MPEKYPPETWSIEKPFDSSDYLDREIPTYEDDADVADGCDPPADSEPTDA